MATNREKKGVQSRRTFLRGAAWAAFAPFFPVPAGLDLLSWPSAGIPGKDPGIRVLNDRPLNAELPPHLLDDLITPASRLFVRNNGIPPKQVDLDTWELRIEGECVPNPVTYRLADLKRRFPQYTYQLTIECAGNGRAEFFPPAKGNQWTLGAVGCPEWTGIRLRDVLEDAGYTDDAVYIGYYGADTHLSGDPDKRPISRGVPMAKALENESLIAWEINGEPLPLQNGYPLRLVFGGWPASTSGKWLSRIAVRNRIHDGAKMGGQSYRVPCHPVSPGTDVPDSEMCIIESMPVKSLITFPRTHARISGEKRLQVRGKAWAGDRKVDLVEISIDFGATWQPAQLAPPANRLAWQAWSAELAFPDTGYYEIWARAQDDQGIRQPMVLPGWNPKGYLNNACHRIAIQVKS
ncbi:sulfite oxidase [Pontibacter sp. G13]|uniref:sulfite oxidase n=1 Tax=Pontibacter sp. G13 TaxID=3074898 RepID=UPI00288C392F|nr:sulfite oxidase [Pontibacter sp. G13]WNJ21582.1 sulfite oxidase [Pontibacter sp. G13]